MNKILIILKSGYEINVTSPETTNGILKNMSLEVGSCLNIGESFILCSEIAAVMNLNNNEQ